MFRSKRATDLLLIVQLEEARAEIDQVLAELAKARKEITELRHQLVAQAIELLGPVHK